MHSIGGDEGQDDLHFPFVTLVGFCCDDTPIYYTGSGILFSMFLT